MNGNGELAQAALHYAREFGWAVHPLVPSRKNPLLLGWKSEATCDAERIREWWRRWPRANIGIACGPSGLAVPDVDVKHGVDGWESWRDLGLGQEAENTVIAETPTGGGHYYYLLNGYHIGNSVGKLGPGLDCKGVGGYVVAPPSRTAGGEYGWALNHSPDDLPVAPLPEKLAVLLAQDEPAGESHPSEKATERVPEGQRNATAFRVACALRRHGVAPDAILACLLEDNALRYNPPLPEDEVRQAAGSSLRYGPASAEELGLAYRITPAEIEAFYGRVTWAWEQWVPEGHVTLVCGPQGVGKSYLLARLMATLTGALPTWPDGQPMTGRTGPVLLCDTEEMRGSFSERLALMGVDKRMWYCPGLRPGDPTYRPVLPRDLDVIERLALEDECSAVLVDSLSGGHSLDENSAQMRGLLQRLVELAGVLQAPVIGAHHTRKKNVLEGVRLSLDKVRGSTTITQFARSVVGVYRLVEHDQAAPSKVEILKASFCKPPEPFGFTLSDKGLEPCQAPEEERAMTATDRATEFLETALAQRPLPYGELLQRAEEQGIAQRTLYRAKDKLRVVVRNRLWGLPGRIRLPGQAPYWPDADGEDFAS